VKVKTASQEDIIKTKARQQVDKLIDAGFVKQHEHKDGFISPRDDVDDGDIAGLFTSNFDLRNPLTVAQGRIELAREECEMTILMMRLMR